VSDNPAGHGAAVFDDIVTAGGARAEFARHGKAHEVVISDVPKKYSLATMLATVR
jgi:hypothetical protein